MDDEAPLEAVDVVLVPDFSNERASTFEARTLFFLASWLLNAGTARHFPLHVACIGEPPASVRRLAEQAGATVTKHEPVRAGFGNTANKLRGLELPSKTGQVFLLDVDMLVLGEISGVTSLGRCLAASPELRPRVPARYWLHIYPALGIEPPAQRISSILGQLLDPAKAHLRTTEQNERLTSMFPYYHGAAVYAPAGCGLRELWERYTREIAGLFTPEDKHWRDLGTSDEAGLAVALVLLLRRGIEFRRLPDEYDVNWPHLLSGEVRWEDAKILHASGAFTVAPDSQLNHEALRTSIDSYCDYLLEDRLKGRHRFDPVLRKDAAAFTEAMHEMRRSLHNMLEDVVGDVLA